MAAPAEGENPVRTKRRASFARVRDFPVFDPKRQWKFTAFFRQQGAKPGITSSADRADCIFFSFNQRHLLFIFPAQYSHLYFYLI